MTLLTSLPVHGYTPQSSANVALVNHNKETEERLLRIVDNIIAMGFDARWAHVAKTHFEQGFMALNRSIMQPKRMSLPEDHDVPDAPNSSNNSAMVVDKPT